MKIEIPIRVLKSLSFGDNAEQPIFEDLMPSWYSDECSTQDLNTAHFNTEQLKSIEDFIEKDLDVDKTKLEGVKTSSSKEEWDKAYNKCTNKFKRWRRLMEQGSSSVFKSLSGIPAIFEGYLDSLPNSRFYQYDEYERLIGWVAIECKHNPADRNGSPAYVSFKFAAFKNGTDISFNISVEMHDVKDGLTISSLLEKNELFPETDELNDQYEALIQKMGAQIDSKGEVYVGDGVAETVNTGRYSYGSSKFYFKDKDQSKVVMDHQGPFVEDTDKAVKILSMNQTVHSRITMEQVQNPIHPYVNVFHLEEHRWLSCHVDAVEKYEFVGEELMKKLVLPEEHKLLIKILMNMSKIDIEDIVSGKKGGSFIMATGLPGTGKTLTAEIFSETIGKPLYKVQCSQLGLSVETVEKKLKQILERASRWGAILLIDEADVYVRARGTDIEQNAIVGVFLRTLEYYTGILFMTSNLETEIDDAIMSRATAHIQYTRPSASDLYKIWKILSTQFKINLSDEDISEMLQEFPNLVGRDVKALLKLGKMYSTDSGEPCNAKMLKLISGFVPNVVKTKI